MGGGSTAKPVGAGLPAMLATRSGRYTAAMPSRASPLPQKILPNRRFCWQCITCGSWLACDTGDAVWPGHRSAAIAGKPAPTKAPGKAQSLLAMTNLWELACLRCGRRGLAGTPQGYHRGQARSHRGDLVVKAGFYDRNATGLCINRKPLANAPARAKTQPSHNANCGPLPVDR